MSARLHQVIEVNAYVVAAWINDSLSSRSTGAAMS